MSWYRKSPAKHPKSHHTHAHRSSPASEKYLEQTKKTRGAERTEKEHKEEQREQHKIDFYA